VSRATSLVARENEVDRALHSLRFSGGVLIAGEAGVGKTLLAASLAERLSAPPVAWIVATAASRSIPLGALTRLLPPDLATIHPALVAQHVSTRLRELSRDQRSTAAPVLVVDDLQLLDPQSAAVLLSLVGARSVRLLGTMRTGESPSDAVTALWKEQLVDRMDLEPLGRGASRELLTTLLGSPVASGTTEMLWQSSHGNPFYLTELARFGADHGLLECQAGVWWWTGEEEMPPRLGELLQGRLDALTDDGREAVAVLALGEPLPYETLSAVVGEDAIMELDRNQIITSDERDGVVLLRFSHPLLHSVAERQLSPAHRRILARRLRDAPAEHVDIVRRAMWEDAGGGEPNVDLLLAAADAVLLNDPAAALRLANRAYQVGRCVKAAVTVASAQSELGRPDRARVTLEEARPLVRTEGDRFRFAAEELSLALWGERDPDQAWAAVERLRSELGSSGTNYVLGAEAVIRLFTGGCVEVIEVANRVLDNDPDPHQRIRALTCLTGALAFADRGEQAIAAGQQLLNALAHTRVSATRTGLAYALVAVTGLFFGVEYRLPRPVGRTGRWPGEPERLGPQFARAAALAADPDADLGADLGWPLLVGLKRHFLGDLAGAVGPLREAYVQQQAGEGLFRSEATAELVVVLAELGEVDDAVAIMGDHPPDEIAIVPGLTPWAQSALDAATGHHARATASAIEAARIAARQGAAAMAMNFLTDAARYGDPREAAAVLPTLGLPLDTPLQQVRAADILARAQRDPQVLIAAAEAQLAANFNRHAFELGELARAADERGTYARPIAALLRQARERLGRAPGSAAALAPSPLTQRETEVTQLAGRGMSDKEIAEELVLSIRTVQSHLASAYRKLGIASRSELKP
jgi:DNA-binding NarL/FixJ family response regulator